MATTKRKVTRADIMPPEQYAAVREEHRARLRQVKKHRRVAVGPCAAFYFENHDTMWMQIHEMLYIEKGGDEQIEAELAAYNPLIPKGRELVATLMFEIDHKARREALLSRLGGVERTATLSLAGETVKAVPEEDVERTTQAGRTSSVHFLHFPFSDEQAAKFREPGMPVTLGIAHDGYAHMARLSEATRRALAEDFD